MKNTLTIEKGKGAIIASPSTLFYISGYDNVDACMVIANDQAIYITDRRYEEGARYKLEDLRVEIVAQGESYIDCAIRLLREMEIDSVYVEERHLVAIDYIAISQAFSTVEFLSQAITTLRRKKTLEEYSNIKNAQRITDQVFCELLEYVEEGVSEKDCAQFIKNRFFDYGATEAFDTIVAFSENASLPHAILSDRKLVKGDSILVDFGAKLNGYCSDMTRTFCYKECSADFVAKYNVVLEAQRTGIGMLKIGANCADVHNAVVDVFSRYGYADNFKHSLGHGVGIDIHEAPYLSSKSTEILAIGDVVTIEPGLYFDNQLGIRIEDLLILTEIGLENLTNSAKELIIVE